MYSLQDSHQRKLIYAVYPSANDKNIFILCSQENQEATLNILQNLQTIIQQIFEPDALATYIPRENSKNPHIPGYPVITLSSQSYASTPVNLTGKNPQDEDMSPEPEVLPSSRKGQYTGRTKTHLQSSLPPNFLKNM